MFKQIFQTIFPLHMLIALATCIYINMYILTLKSLFQLQETCNSPVDFVACPGNE